MYSADYDNARPSAQEIAALIKAKEPSSETVARITEQIKNAFKESL